MSRLLAVLLLIGSALAQMPMGGVTVSPGGGGGAITLANHMNAAGAIPASPYLLTQALGFTASSGNFMVCAVARAINSTTADITSVSINDGVTDYAMTAATTSLEATRGVIILYYRANIAAVTTVKVQFANSGADYAVECGEFSGMATTATTVNTAVTNQSGFVSSTSWSTFGSSHYTATAGNLLIAGCAEIGSVNVGTWTVGTGYTAIDSVNAAQSVQSMIEYQSSPPPGSYDGTGTWSQGAGGQRYESFIVSFK